MRSSVAILITAFLLHTTAPLISSSEVDTGMDVADVQFTNDGSIMEGSGPIVENIGQMDDDIGYYTSGNLRMAFRDGYVQFALSRVEGETTATTSFNMEFQGANVVKPVGVDLEEGVYNFINSKGSFPGAKLYSSVIYPDLYQGIDLLFDVSGSEIKYEFHLEPYADPDGIVIHYNGIQDMVFNGNDLILESLLGPITDRSPVSFQNEVVIPTDYIELGEHTIGFDLGDYDRSEPLVIDPFLEASTFLGGTNYQDPWTDPLFYPNGDIVVGGTTGSRDFPTTPGAYQTYINSYYGDIFISRFSPDLSKLRFSTFLGGAQDDYITDISISGDGRYYISGYTKSTDYPVTPDAYDTTHQIELIQQDEWEYYTPDGIVTIISSDGSKLDASTYIGGNNTDYPNEIEIDSLGNIYISGFTLSTNYPTFNAFQSNHSDNHGKEYDPYDNSTWISDECFLTKFDTTLSSLTYSTFFGGEYNWNQTGQDLVFGMVLVDNDHPVITGRTDSRDFPVTEGTYKDEWGNGTFGYNGYVIKFSDTGDSLEWSTYLDLGAHPMDIKEDHEGNFFIAGDVERNITTSESAYQRFIKGFRNAFVLYLTSNGDRVPYCTLIGSNYFEDTYSLVLDNDNEPWIIGETYSDKYPCTVDQEQFQFKGYSSAFISHFSRNLSKLKDSFLLGGSNYDNGVGINCNINGSIYVFGDTSSNDFPFTEHAYDKEVNSDPWGWADDTYISMIDLHAFAPSEPLNMAIEEGNAYLNISWSPPTNNGNRSILGYQIYRSTGTVFLMIEEVGAKERSFNDTGLQNGQTYWYKVKAKNKVDLGPFSNMVGGTPATIPTAPLNIATAYGDSQINVSWSKPESDGGDPELRYNLYYGTIHDGLEPYAKDLDGRYMIVDGLNNGVKYHFRVSAVNRIGEGPVSVITSDTPMKVPSNPFGLSAEPGDSIVTLNWSLPEDLGGDDEVTFSVLMSRDNATFDDIKKHLDETSLVVEGLNNGRDYYFAITASNSEGEGPMSEIVWCKPMGLPGVPKELTVRTSSGCASLDWEPPSHFGGDVKVTYNIYRGMSDTDLLLVASAIEGTVFEVTGLENGVEYYFTISAVNTMGEGEQIDPIPGISYGLPSRPRGLTAEISDGEVYLEWEQPSDLGGFTLIEYQVFVGTSEDSLVFQSATSDTHATVRNLRNGISYHFNVRAFNNHGEGPYTDMVQATPMGLPEAPNLLFIEPGNGSMNILWSAPSDLGGALSVQYSVYYWNDGPLPETPQVQEIEDNEVLITGLQNGKQYNVAVSGVTATGEGPMSNIVSAIPIGLPGAPLNLSVIDKGDRFEISWSSPVENGGEEPSKYHIFRSDDDGAPALIKEVEGSVLFFIDKDVRKDVRYTYTVRAENSAGKGAASQQIEASLHDEEESSMLFFLVISVFIVISIVIAVLLLLVLRQKRAARTLTSSQLQMMNNYEYQMGTGMPSYPALQQSTTDQTTAIPPSETGSAEHLPKAQLGDNI